MWKILGLFVNTLTSDGKYSLVNKANLTQPIQMQLSKKQKTFSEIFCTFEIQINFWTFWNKRWPS